MRKKLGLGALLALLLAVGSVSLASAGSSGKKRSDSGRVQVIEVVERTVQDAELDLDNNEELSLGDQFVFASDLFRDGKKVGTDGGACTIVRLEPPSAIGHCVATLSLPKGQVTVQGLITFSEEEGVRFVIAVTGGTGAYRTAHGQLAGESLSEQDSRLTLKLIL